MPTFRCQLKCGHCVGRALPIVSHGTERSPQEWIAALKDCPREVKPIVPTGREPTLYEGLSEVLGALQWPVKIETNLLTPLDSWLTEDVEPLVVHVHASLHHHPQHKVAARFWSNVETLRARLHPEGTIAVHMCVTQREIADEVETARMMAKERGVGFKAGGMDEAFMFREVRPDRGPATTCTAGQEIVVLAPDGAMFRCVGHTYFNQCCLGNIFEDGWGLLLEEPLPCDVTPCACEFGRAVWPDEEIV